MADPKQQQFPTPKQVAVVKAKVKSVLEDIPQGVVAREVFPTATPASASVMMSRELKSVNIQEMLQAALEQHGLTPTAVVKVVAAGMKARKTIGEAIPVYGTVEDKNGEEVQKIVSYKHRTAVDHSIRLKAAGMAAKFMGADTAAQEGGIHFHQHVETKKDSYAFGG
jgi:hypothetical protein